MTKFMTILSLVTMFSTGAFANAASEQLLASALISRQIQAQVSEFNQLVTYVSSVKIETFEDLDVITLQGTVLRGGDIACGTATLKINKSSQPGFGFNRVTVYQAEVSKNLVASCQ